jgi:hemolysin III
MATTSAAPTRAGDEVVPLLRGLLHAYAFCAALVAAPLLVMLAPSGAARASAVIYGAALCALFAISALYHRWRWDPRWRPLLRRLDHSTIYVFIAASATPLALLVLSGTLQTVVLISAWLGALGGIAMTIAWIDAPRALVALSYVLVGWAAVAGIPQIIDRLPLAPLLLLAAGALLYMTGAAVYATRRPDPWPTIFGFHEVFHGLVLAAAAAHFATMIAWVVPGAPAG